MHYKQTDRQKICLVNDDTNSSQKDAGKNIYLEPLKHFTKATQQRRLYIHPRKEYTGFFI